MALSNQSDLPAFFQPLESQIKNSHRIIPNPTMLEDDMPRMAKTQKMTFQDWPNPDLQQAGISKEDLMKPAA
jgi:hypothetical protein